MGPELLRVKDRHNKDLLFSPTHEEAITSCMANMKPIPAKGLPIRAYQVNLPHRNKNKNLRFYDLPLEVVALKLTKIFCVRKKSIAFVCVV